MAQFILSLLVAFLFSLSGSALSIAHAVAPQKIVFAFAGVNERYGCLFVAKDRRFFDEQGLDLQIVQMGSLAKWLRLARPDDTEAGYETIKSVYDRRLAHTKGGLRNALRILTRFDAKFGRLKTEDLIDDGITRKLESDK